MELSFRKEKTATDRTQKRRRRLKILKAAFATAIVIALIGVCIYFLPKDMSGTFQALARIKNVTAFYVLGYPPHFYYLEGEKNGKDFRLASSNSFVVSYRDEFVVKNVATDDLWGRHLSIRIDGFDDKAGLGTPVKGVMLVDRVLPFIDNLKSGIIPTSYSIHIRYRDQDIAAIPISIDVTPQDMLRYAKRSENRKEQIDYLKKALTLSGDDIQVRRMLGDAYQHSGMIKEAIAQYQAVLKIKPADQAILAGLAKCFVQDGEFERAIDAYNKIVQINPKDGTAFANMGAAYGRLGQWGKAVSCYREAVRLAPNLAPVYLKYGEALEKTQKPQEAIDQYRTALKIDPSSLIVRNALADTYLKRKNYDEAIGVYKELIKMDMNNAAAYANMGVAYGAKGSTAQEIECYRKALS
ncbi:MAG: tetratricopeptide repeat protein, partial [Syntrophales bacterium]|nr:tetratricopeptide repeat protein [Syntrophales bacterium]